MFQGKKREILIYPDPVLKLVAAPVTVFDDNLKQIVADLFETLYTDSTNGVGLAATQVGILQRIFIFDESGSERKQPYCFINPIIVESFGSITNTEGCLSLPDCSVAVERFQKIKLEYYDIDGNKHFLEPETTLLTIGCQHEIDHLNGITLFDHINSKIKKTLVLNKLIAKKKKLKAKEKFKEKTNE